MVRPRPGGLTEVSRYVTDIKSVLTQKALDSFCETFHIPAEVHPQLPVPNQTIHEMPTMKIAAKVSHFEILCRVDKIEPTAGLFGYFYVNSKNKGWMSFSKRPDSDTDLFPKPTEFRADDYAFLAAHPALFWKFLEPFLCLIGMSRHYTLDEDTYPNFLHEDGTEMDLFAFIQVVDPTKVKVGEQERAEGEARLLGTTVGHVVPLLLVALAHAERELDASVDKFFDESGGADQGDSATEDVAIEKPKRPRKKRQVAADASGPSYPSKKLRSDHGTSGGAASAGKSPTILKKLLASSILNVESGVEAVATFPFVTSSVSATLEHESGVPADSITGLNIRTVGASARFVISSDSSHHSSIKFPRAEGDSILRSVAVPPVMTEAVTTTHVATIPSVMAPESGTKAATPVHASMFHDSESTGMARPDVTDNLDASREFIDHVAPPVLFAQIRDMDYDELFIEFSVGTARQACLSAEVRMRTEYCLSERRRLESESEKQATAEQVHVDELNTLKQRNVALEDEKKSLNRKVAELQSLVSVKDRELKDVNATVTSLKSQNDRLVDHVVNDKFDQLHTDFVEMALHLEEKFYPRLLTTISYRRWLLTQGLELTVVKCLNSPEYLSMLGAATSKAIENELKANKDAIVETLMDLLRPEEPLAKKLGLHEFQPTFDQLMVPIHHSPDQTVIGATALSALRDAFVPLVEPFSSADLIGTEGTSSVVPAAAHTNKALSMTFSSTSIVPPITIEDYEFTGVGGPEVTQGSGEVSSFPQSVDFEKEELDTTPERDPPS
ncbi:hypothetical protein Tco_0468288 [Tanacetum coccineum]